VAGVIVALGPVVLGIPSTSPNQTPSSRRSVDDLLFIAFVADVALFIWLTPISTAAYARYLTAAVIFGAILAARLIARMFGLLDSGAFPCCWRYWYCSLCLYASAVGINVAQFVAEQPRRPTGSFPRCPPLTSGVGDYWSSSNRDGSSHPMP